MVADNGQALRRAAQQAESGTTVDEVMSVFTGALASVGLPHAIYVTMDPEFSRPHAWSNIGLYDEVAPPREDPFLRYLCDAYAPTFTGTAFLEDHTYLGDAERKFIEGAADLGFTAGIAIPVRLRGSSRFGGFNYGTDSDRDSFTDHVAPLASPLYTGSLLVHRKLEELFMGATAHKGFRARGVAPAAAPDLTDREAEVLFLLSQGYARKEIAHFCTISPNTVGSYIKNIYRKLGVKNRAEATRKALDMGLKVPALSRRAS